MKYFWQAFFSSFFTRYIFEIEWERTMKRTFGTSEQDRRKKRIEGLEDVLTDEEKGILMNL